MSGAAAFERHLAKVCMWTRSHVAQVVLLINAMDVASAHRPYAAPDCTELLAAAVELRHVQLISALCTASTTSVRLDLGAVRARGLFLQIALLGLADVCEVLAHRGAADAGVLHPLLHATADRDGIVREAMVAAGALTWAGSRELAMTGRVRRDTGGSSRWGVGSGR